MLYHFTIFLLVFPVYTIMLAQVIFCEGDVGNLITDSIAEFLR